MWALVQNRRIERLVTHEIEQEQTTASSDGTPELRQHSPRKQKSENPRKESAKRILAADSHGWIWVGTSGEDDPIDPRNWTLLSRSKNIGILVFLIFTQGWAGSADSPANERASREFGVSQTAQNLSTAMYLFGIGSGSLFAGPLSESIGRNPTYLVSTFIYLLFVLGSALTPTFTGQVICRYFVGLCSSPTLSINGSSVGDQFRPVKRTFVFPAIAWANIADKFPVKARSLNTDTGGI
jgi:hypothetical protein